MAEPLAAAVHAVARGSDAADVGILGGGPMGLMLTALLVAEGRSVTLADPHPERREQATELGARASRTLDDQHELVFEAVGRPETWRAAAAAAAPGGVVVLVGGCPSGTEVTLRPARSTTRSSSCAGRSTTRPTRSTARSRCSPPTSACGERSAGRRSRSSSSRPRWPRLPGGRRRSGWWTLGPDPPELQVLDDPARVADRLAVDHQHRHAPLTGQRHDLGPSRAPLRDDDLLERDPSRASARATFPHGHSQFVGVVQR